MGKLMLNPRNALGGRVQSRTGAMIATKMPFTHPELIENPSFDEGGEDWTAGPGWTFGIGEAICDGTQAATSDLVNAFVPDAMVTYSTTLEVLTRTVGAVFVRIGGVSGTSRNAPGIYQENITTNSAALAGIRANTTFAGSVGGLSVRLA